MHSSACSGIDSTVIYGQFRSSSIENDCVLEFAKIGSVYNIFIVDRKQLIILYTTYFYNGICNVHRINRV